MDVDAFAASWAAAWNARDLDAILAHYAEDAEFTSPVARRRGAGEEGTVRGKAALRAYFADALREAPTLRFRVLDALRGVDGLTLYYEAAPGQRAAETMLLDARGLVRRAFVSYARPGKAP